MPREILLLPEGILSQVPFMPAAMIDDLLAAGGLAAEQIESLADILDREAGIPSDLRLEEIVTGILGEGSLADSVLRTIINLRPDRIESAVRNLKQWRNANAANEARVSLDQLEIVRKRLTELIENYPVLARYRKSQRLRTLTGRAAESLELICDLRPVFDPTRRLVEGLIPITTLRVEYRTNDGSSVLEVLVTEEDLDNLASEVERAKQKLQSLKESVTRWVPAGWVDGD